MCYHMHIPKSNDAGVNRILEIVAINDCRIIHGTSHHFVPNLKGEPRYHHSPTCHYHLQYEASYW